MDILGSVVIIQTIYIILLICFLFTCTGSIVHTVKTSINIYSLGGLLWIITEII